MRQPNTNPKICDRVFVSKSYEAALYKWSPPCNQTLNKSINVPKGKPYFCTATIGSQGEDWITTYVYDLIYVNNKHEHLAYVECDYVQ
jgi:hypothetical protein